LRRDPARGAELLVIGYWLLEDSFGIWELRTPWDLELGIWDFESVARGAELLVIRYRLLREPIGIGGKTEAVFLQGCTRRLVFACHAERRRIERKTR
jgi:hypothetical protein